MKKWFHIELHLALYAITISYYSQKMNLCVFQGIQYTAQGRGVFGGQVQI